MSDPLFAYLAELQGAEPWGHVLDAGTGWGSASWLLGLPLASFTGVTGDATWARQLRTDFAPKLRPFDRFLTGNWADPGLLEGERFDTVVADYLLGALDRWAPYRQDDLFRRLHPLVGKRLYVVGLEPYPEPPSSEDEKLVLEIARLRDACHLLAGQRPHREYPLAWTLEALRRSGFEVRESRLYPIVYARRFVEEELDLTRRTIESLKPANLARALGAVERDLRARALRHLERRGGLAAGADYVIAARPTREGAP
ncbi:class I SAM-dependent methyltransferase [bacterium CPR1]|nr:class I SAM-dependent methyltransferase [bacterium CPR1]